MLEEGKSGNQELNGQPPPQKKKVNFRDDLKNLVKRYHKLLGNEVKETEGLLEIFIKNSKKSPFKYVFNRKDSMKHPEAELYSFNSEELMNLLADVVEKGRIAKAFIPFKFEPKESFTSALKKLIIKSPSGSGNYIQNGEIESLGVHINYVPFLMFIVKIQLDSIESHSVIEKPIIPLIALDIDIDIDVNHYISRLNEYFLAENPILSTEMPIKGDILDINEKKFKNILHDTVMKIKSSVIKQKDVISRKLNERLQKELDILDKYYDQLKYELESQIESARERGKREEINELQAKIERIEEERKFKTGEYETIYQVETDFEVLGAALIYIPAIFNFRTKITTSYGEFEKNLKYDIFKDKIIPPKCSCGRPIYQGIVCENHHLSCPNCSYKCQECGKHICKACNIQFCKRCGAALCEDDFHECEHCKETGEVFRYVCILHYYKCEKCGTMLCPDCSITCKFCFDKRCLNNSECSFHCEICNQYMCPEHTATCSFDNGVYCTDEFSICNSCHQSYCKYHMATRKTCKMCADATTLAFYKFNRNRKGKLHVPEQVRLSDDNSIRSVYVKRRKYNIPSNQLKIRMGESKNFLVFIIRKISDNFVLLHEKESKEETLFRSSNSFGKFKDLFRRVKLPSKILLRGSSVILPLSKKKRKRK